MKTLGVEYIYHFKAHGSSPHLFTLSLAGEEFNNNYRHRESLTAISISNLLQVSPGKTCEEHLS